MRTPPNPRKGILFLYSVHTGRHVLFAGSYPAQKIASTRAGYPGDAQRGMIIDNHSSIGYSPAPIGNYQYQRRRLGSDTHTRGHLPALHCHSSVILRGENCVKDFPRCNLLFPLRTKSSDTFMHGPRRPGGRLLLVQPLEPATLPSTAKLSSCLPRSGASRACFSCGAGKSAKQDSEVTLCGILQGQKQRPLFSAL